MKALFWPALGGFVAAALGFGFLLGNAFRTDDGAATRLETVATAAPAAIATQVRATAVPQPTATPQPGCYAPKPPNDSLVAVSAEPPLDTAPAGKVSITVQYTLDSIDRAFVTLHAGGGATGFPSAAAGKEVPIERGTGTVVLDQTTAFVPPNSVYFSVFMSPRLEDYRAMGYRCFSPMVVLPLNYPR